MLRRFAPIWTVFFLTGFLVAVLFTVQRRSLPPSGRKSQEAQHPKGSTKPVTRATRNGPLPPTLYASADKRQLLPAGRRGTGGGSPGEGRRDLVVARRKNGVSSGGANEGLYGTTTKTKTSIIPFPSSSVSCETLTLPITVFPFEWVNCPTKPLVFPSRPDGTIPNFPVPKIQAVGETVSEEGSPKHRRHQRRMLAAKDNRKSSRSAHPQRPGETSRKQREGQPQSQQQYFSAMLAETAPDAELHLPSEEVLVASNPKRKWLQSSNEGLPLPGVASLFSLAGARREGRLNGNDPNKKSGNKNVSGSSAQQPGAKSANSKIFLKDTGEDEDGDVITVQVFPARGSRGPSSIYPLGHTRVSYVARVVRNTCLENEQFLRRVTWAGEVVSRSEAHTGARLLMDSSEQGAFIRVAMPEGSKLDTEKTTTGIVEQRERRLKKRQRRTDTENSSSLESEGSQPGALLQTVEDQDFAFTTATPQASDPGASISPSVLFGADNEESSPTSSTKVKRRERTRESQRAAYGNGVGSGYEGAVMEGQRISYATPPAALDDGALARDTLLYASGLTENSQPLEEDEFIDSLAGAFYSPEKILETAHLNVDDEYLRCSFNITVRDVEPPTFTFCPGNRDFHLPKGVGGQQRVIMRYDKPMAVDNSEEPLVIYQTKGLKSGSSLGVGRHAYEFVAQDAAGNKAFCQFRVRVIKEFDEAGTFGVEVVEASKYTKSVKPQASKRVSFEGVTCSLKKHTFCLNTGLAF